MAGMIPQSFIDDLLGRLPIQDVVSSRIPLKRSGSSLKACCPFHQEKTPSFHVLPQKNFYHCFGCGMSGDAISFLREFDSLSFNEAVEELARMAGLEVPRDERDRSAFDAQKKLLDGLNAAALAYRNALKNHPQNEVVKRYMQRRGLSDEIIERFALGFAPAERHFIGAATNPDVVKAMIQTRNISDKYQQNFDLFQNRLMFPIRNMSGKVVAFGGRTLGDDKAKYINSPESDVFHKSNEIYGLYEATRANVRLDKLLVVEGYMDVVSLAQFGVSYAVATLGTATNEENLGQLLKRCSKLVFCFDGDAAGRQAARKAMENMLPLYREGMELLFILLPEGEDPDTLVRQEGKEAFEQRVQAARPLSQFFFQIYAEGLDLKVPEQKGVLKERAEEQIKRVGSGVLKTALWRELNRILYARSDTVQPEARTAFQDVAGSKVLRNPDSSFCLALYYQPHLASGFLDLLDGVADYAKASEFARFIANSTLESTEDLLLTLATGESAVREHFAPLFESIDMLPDSEQVMAELEDLKQRINAEKKRDSARRATKLNKSPGQLSKEELQALKEFKELKGLKQSRPH